MEEKELTHRLEMAKQSNEAAIKYSERSVLYLFYLNGGAATALLARAEQAFYPAAASLAWGAFFAVICMGLSYWYQMLMTSTWYADPQAKTCKVPFIVQLELSFRTIDALRILPVIFWILAAVQFMRGISQI